MEKAEVQRLAVARKSVEGGDCVLPAFRKFRLKPGARASCESYPEAAPSVNSSSKGPAGRGGQAFLLQQARGTISAKAGLRYLVRGAHIHRKAATGRGPHGAPIQLRSSKAEIQ